MDARIGQTKLWTLSLIASMNASGAGCGRPPRVRTSRECRRGHQRLPAQRRLPLADQREIRTITTPNYLLLCSLIQLHHPKLHASKTEPNQSIYLFKSNPNKPKPNQIEPKLHCQPTLVERSVEYKTFTESHI